MAKLTLVPGLDKIVEATPEIRAACLDVAGKVATEAQGIAGREYYRTGAFQAGIVAAIGESETGPTAQVQGTDWKSRLQEFGFTSRGVTRPPKAIIRRAAEALGYSVKVTHK